MDFEQAKEWTFKNFGKCLEKLARSDYMLQKLYDKKKEEDERHRAAIGEILGGARKAFRVDIQELANRGYEIILEERESGYSCYLHVEVTPPSAEIEREVRFIHNLLSAMGIYIRKEQFLPNPAA